MIKKLFSLMTLFCLLSAETHASVDHGLKKAFDELNYALTVEWDQRDKEFYENQIADFHQKLKVLKEAGMTQAQMIEAVKANVHNGQLASELDQVFKVIEAEKMNPEEATAFMSETMKQSYRTGSNWSGNAANTIIVAAALVIVISAALSVSAWAYAKVKGCTYGTSCHYDIVSGETVCRPGCF